MFASGLLDRFTRVHPAVPVLIYLPVIAVLFVTGAGRLGAAHRARARARAATPSGRSRSTGCTASSSTSSPSTGIGARLHWMIHGVHHDHPNDPMRLVMPPSASVPLALAFYGALLARARRRRRARPSAPASSPATSPTTCPLRTCTTTCRARRSGAGCASCTCATTSRTTSAASASARRTGTTCSEPHHARAIDDDVVRATRHAVAFVSRDA